MNPYVDLRQLARRVEAPVAGPAPPRRLLARYVLPGAVLLGFLGVLAWALRDSLLPARPVTVVPVVVTRAEGRQEAGTPLFQAAGWVEPRPTPILVTALAEGVVEQFLVVEGQQIKAGEPVARLVDADARLALAAAEADIPLREAERDAARAAVAAARTSAAQPVHLEAAAAEADAALAKVETELANLPFQLRVAEARLRLATTILERRKMTAQLLPAESIDQAQTEVDATNAQVDELKSRRPRLEREAAALRQRRDAVRKQLELLTEETRRLAEAEAGVRSAEARVRLAQIAVDAAKLRLERMTVRAPYTGRVLGLVARPGARLMGLAAGTHQDSSTVVTLYDPASLQVRADVRLEDVPRVRPGQPVRVETPSVPGGTIEGEVLFPTSQANIQKNTLEVKVALKSPPDVLRPDMLVQATFLALPDVSGTASGEERLRLLVPRQLVEVGEGGARVWIVEAGSSVARLRTVKTGTGSGELVEVLDGLTPADRLISGGRDGLREGQRVSVTGEDATLGVAARVGDQAGGRPARLAPAAGGHQGKH